MKKLVIINAIPYGSTGKIVRGIAECAKRRKYESYIFYSWTKSLKKSVEKNVYIGSFLDKALHICLSKVTGLNGCFGIIDTYFLIKEIKKLNPDVINLHILHCWNVNLPILFRFLKKSRIPVVWTMHDCWAVTGQCPHFSMIGCSKWITGCYQCPQHREYPGTFVDQSKLMWKLKKKWFTSIEKMTIVTPSNWLSSIIKQSFLKEFPVAVINNGIDLNIFKPTKSNFRKMYNCENKYIILGVAFEWSNKKGLDVFIELSNFLDKNYQIIMVGIDKNIKRSLPPQIITINRTANQKELAEIYSVADVFINPTREDTFPTVNLEALACGTPVITFRTGGSPECVDETCGFVIERDNIEQLIEKIKIACTQKPFLSHNCILKGRNYDQNKKFNEYIDLITKIEG